ncbi:MAG: FAD-dependent oxidoreductase [Leucobacter sp.]
MNAIRTTGMRPSFDVAVVGAGPAGLAAANAAADQDARVFVVDSADQPGGQYWRHRSEAANVDDDGALHHGWDEYLDLRRVFDAHISTGNITFAPRTSVWMTRKLADSTFALELAPSWGKPVGPASARATRLVLATGGYDRQLPVPGWDLPGVMAAGGIQGFTKQNGTLPGKRFVIAGTGPFLLPVAANIVAAGGSVAAVCESANLTGWLPRAHRAAGVPSKGIEGAVYVWTFLKHRIPYRTRTVITEILGSDHVTGVRTAKVRQNGEVVSGSEREITGIDGVGLGWGFTPQLELPLQLGVDTRVDADGSLVATVDGAQHSSVDGLLLAGELTGVGGAVLAVLEGRIAGRVAGAEAQGRSAADRGVGPSASELRAIHRQRSFAEAMHLAHPIPAGWQDRLTSETNVCRCEEVTAGEICASRETLAAVDQRTQKGLTRAGMGWCQGRVCGFAVSSLAANGEADHDSLASAAKRPIAQPLTLAQLAALDD